MFADFAEEDLLSADLDSATAQLANMRIHAERIGFLTATSKESHESEYEMEAVAYVFMLDGKWQRRNP